MTTVPMAGRLREWVRPLTRQTGPPPRLTRHGQLFDVVVALVTGFGAVYYVLDNMTGILGDANRPVHLSEWLSPVIVAVVATPSDAPRLTFYACVIAAYSAAAYSPRRVPTLASLVAAVLLVGTDPTLPAVPTQYAPT